METKHTPGPWEVVSTVAHPFAVHSDGKQLAVAQSAMNTIPGPERAANARLIAAAPELLEALMQANSQMELAGDCIEAGRISEALLHVCSLSRQRKAAIAKAIGNAI